jgi:DNA-binding response OmpR family regulator
VRQWVAADLRNRGYGVLEVRTSIEALLLSVEIPYSIDLLVTSLDLRKFCNGFELAGCLRTTHPEIAVIYLASEGVRNADAEAEAMLGEAFLLPKPIGSDALAEAIAGSEARFDWHSAMEKVCA